MIARALPLIFVIGACQPQSPDDGERQLMPAPATVVAELRMHKVLPASELPAAGAAAAERASAAAIGIVYSQFGDTLPVELVVVNDTAAEVQTIARVRYYTAPDGGWADTIWATRPGLFGQLTRASHEEYGLQTVAVHGNWARAIFAYDSAGGQQLGWVRVQPGRVQHARYDSLMLNTSTSLTDDSAATFFDEPDGKRVRLSLAPSHALRVIGFKQDWIQVAVTVPDTTECTGDPQTRVVRRDTVWVPRINTNGRRQLDAAVAGC